MVHSIIVGCEESPIRETFIWVGSIFVGGSMRRGELSLWIDGLLILKNFPVIKVR